jgi:hypothetical protein
LLQRSSPLSRVYQQLEDESPSPALDRAVIDAAREAIGAPTRQRVWQWPTLALAATVLLSFGIVMRLALQPGPQSAVPAKPVPATEELDKTFAATPAAGTLEPQAAGSMDSASVPRAAPPKARSDLAPPGSDEGARRAEFAAAREHMQNEPVSAERLKAVSPPMAESEAKMEVSAAVAPAAQPAESTAETRLNGLSTAAPVVGRTLGTAAAPATSAASVPKDARQKAAAKKSGVKPAREWLDEIARLRASGQEEAAEREYASFRKAYPNYVPESDTAAPDR